MRGGGTIVQPKGRRFESETIRKESSVKYFDMIVNGPFSTDRLVKMTSRAFSVYDG